MYKYNVEYILFQMFEYSKMFLSMCSKTMFCNRKIGIVYKSIFLYFAQPF